MENKEMKKEKRISDSRGKKHVESPLCVNKGEGK